MEEITILNAAGGLMVAEMAKDFAEGIEIASQTIKSGQAYSHFVDFVKENGSLQKIKEMES
jgi:anthranilate phosphoribosyltransferase